MVTTGAVSITVKDPLESAQAAATITQQAGGRIDSRTENPGIDGQPASATLVLRIPADKLDQAVALLKKLGTVNKFSLNAADITQQTQDLDARITSLQTSVDRLLALMATATDTADLIAIESALSQRQTELEASSRSATSSPTRSITRRISLDLHAVGTVRHPNPTTSGTASSPAGTPSSPPSAAPSWRSDSCCPGCGCSASSAPWSC